MNGIRLLSPPTQVNAFHIEDSNVTSLHYELTTLACVIYYGAITLNNITIFGTLLKEFICDVYDRETCMCSN